MGYPCYGKGKSADFIAGDAELHERGGYRPAAAVNDPTIPHKCWYIPALEAAEHVCWIDSSVHPKVEHYGVNLAPVPVLAPAPQPAIEHEDEHIDDDGFEDDNNEEDQDNHGAVASGSAGSVGRDVSLNHRMKMDTLFGKNVFRVGDEWRFSFLVPTRTGNVLVEKDATVTDLGSVHGRSRRYPIFRHAPGHHKTPGPGTGPDVVLGPCNGPQEFVQAMMATYGPIPGKTRGPWGKAWNSVRLFRNSQDLGTLNDVRVAYDPNRTY